MRTAIIHYWLVGMRGGEKVLEAMCRLFPQADIYTHVYDPASVSQEIRKHTVRTTFIGKLPNAQKYYQKYLPLMPLALEQLDLRGYDLVISSESGPAKGVLTGSATPHICYCHTPMRYLWDMYQDYLAEQGTLTRAAMRLLTPGLRRWDVLSSMRVDHFAANSATVAARIQKHYRRDSTVIYPPVDVAAFTPENGRFSPPATEAPYLCLGQLVGYKRADIAVKACSATKRRLVVIGDGPMRKKLEATAGQTVQFLGWTESRHLKQQILGCKALLFPGEEDFGIVPVEVQAAGRPVIAYRGGGVLETVKEEVSGIFFDQQTEDSLIDALNTFERHANDFDPVAISAHAKPFAPEFFDAAFMSMVDTAVHSTSNTFKL